MKLLMTLILAASTVSPSANAQIQSCELNVSRNKFVVDIVINKGYSIPRNRIVDQRLTWEFNIEAAPPTTIVIDKIPVTITKYTSLFIRISNQYGRGLWDNSTFLYRGKVAEIWRIPDNQVVSESVADQVDLHNIEEEEKFSAEFRALLSKLPSSPPCR